jgi:hypothetical protein
MSSIASISLFAVQTLEEAAASFEHRLSGKRGSNKKAEKFSH